MTTVLLTGFEPFDGQPVNASWAAVREVAAGWTGPVAGDIEREGDRAEPTLVVRLLPVSFVRAPERLAALIVEHTPELVVCTGEAGGRDKLSVERVAVNIEDARIPDADGAQPVDEPVTPGGPVGHFSSLPVKAALVASRQAGVPTEVSNTAGTYVCNAIAYALGDLLASGLSPQGARGGFVHVPRLPEQMPEGGPSMTAELAGRGLAAVLDAALSITQDVRVAAGVES